MSNTLKEIAQQLKAASKKVQLIYAFNGTGKTRLSREFKTLISPKAESEDEPSSELSTKKILYYSAFTEDLFYWDNDLKSDAEYILKIQPNSFTKWVFEEQGQDRNVTSTFQHYTNEKLTPKFNADFSEVRFSNERGNLQQEKNIKISKGEESNFVWSIFYTLIEQVIDVLDAVRPDYPEATKFDNLEYVFIDDPVSSLDENHLIELAVDLAQLIKTSKSQIKFVITTHNPLFFNVLNNELGSDDKSIGYKAKVIEKYRFEKNEDGKFQLEVLANDSPFSYHLYLKAELDKASSSGKLHKYHFNYLRNILEKTTIFLGYKRWVEILPKANDGEVNPYESRIVNLRSHSKYAGEEVKDLDSEEKRVLKRLVNHLNKIYTPNLEDDQTI